MRSKFVSGGNNVESEFLLSLIQFSPETYVFSSAEHIRTGIYKSIILLGVLYGCETWSQALREEHGLKVFQNRVLRGIFGPKRDEVMGG
jgi:hypothetical protein